MSKLIINKINHEDIDLIIFDKDGTLIDIHYYWGELIKRRCTHLINNYFSTLPNKEEIKESLESFLGFDHKRNCLKPDGPVGVYPRREIVKRLAKRLEGFSLFLSEEEVESIFKKIDIESEKEIELLLKFLPNVASFLEWAYQKKIKLAIATTDITSRAELAFTKLGIRHLFCKVVGSDLVSESKPAKDLCEKILLETGVPEEKAIVIGDHHVDLLMAKNANIKSIAVFTGLGTKETLKEATYHIDNFFHLEIADD